MSSISTAVDSTQHTVPARDESYHLDAPAADIKESTEQPRSLSHVPETESEAFDQMSAKVLHLWEDYTAPIAPMPTPRSIPSPATQY